jgi:hypothetical protein
MQGDLVNLLLLYSFQNMESGLRGLIKSVQVLHVQSDVIPENLNFHQQLLWNKLTAFTPLLQAFSTHSTGALFRQNKTTLSPLLHYYYWLTLTHDRPVLSSKGAPQKQNRNCQRLINIWSYAPDGCFVPGQTGRLTVGRNIRLRLRLIHPSNHPQRQQTFALVCGCPEHWHSILSLLGSQEKPI